MALLAKYFHFIIIVAVEHDLLERRRANVNERYAQVPFELLGEIELVGWTPTLDRHRVTLG